MTKVSPITRAKIDKGMRKVYNLYATKKLKRYYKKNVLWGSKKFGPTKIYTLS